MELALIDQGLDNYFAGSLYPILLLCRESLSTFQRSFADFLRTAKGPAGVKLCQCFPILNLKKQLDRDTKMTDHKVNVKYKVTGMSPTGDLLQTWETAVIDPLHTAKWLYNDSTQTNIVSAFIWTWSKFWETARDEQWVIEDRIITSQRLVTKSPLTWHNQGNIIVIMDLVRHVLMESNCIQNLFSWLSCKTWFLISMGSSSRSPTQEVTSEKGSMRTWNDYESTCVNRRW